MPKDTKIYVSKPRLQLFVIEATIIAVWLGIVAVFMKAGLGEYLAVLVLLAIALVITCGSYLLTAFINVSGLSSRQTLQQDRSPSAEADCERMDVPSKPETASPRQISQR